MAKSKPVLRIPCSGEASTEIHCPWEQNSSFMVTRLRAERIEPMAGRSRFRTAERYFWVGPTRMIPRIKSEPIELQTVHLDRRHRARMRALARTDSRQRSSAGPALSRAAFHWYAKPRFERDLANA